MTNKYEVLGIPESLEALAEELDCADTTIVFDASNEIKRLRKALAEQTEYTANLQRFIECLIADREVPESVLDSCPHHARLLAEKNEV